MLLDEARLKPYRVWREGQEAAALSGLSVPSDSPGGLEVHLDLQQRASVGLVTGEGAVRFTGGYRGFTYDDRLAVGDRLYDTPYGALRVTSVYAWDDEGDEPTHFEVGLETA